MIADYCQLIQGIMAIAATMPYVIYAPGQVNWIQGYVVIILANALFSVPTRKADQEIAYIDRDKLQRSGLVSVLC